MTSTMIKQMRYMLAACVAGALALVTPADAAVLQDNFNDNAAAPVWIPFNQGTTKVKESAHRLCFKSTSDTTGFRRAGYNGNGFTYHGENNGTVTFDFKVDVTGLTGNDSASVGIYTIEPDDASALDIKVYQKASGWFVSLELFVDQGSGLNSILHKVAELDSGTGSIEIKYVKSTDKMTIKVDGDTKITVSPLNGDYGPFDLEVQLYGTTTRTSCGFGDLWIDNFKLVGAISI